MTTPKKKEKRKKTTSFGQFDMGKGSKAAQRQTVVSSDARTITGNRLSKKQKANIARANRKKR